MNIPQPALSATFYPKIGKTFVVQKQISKGKFGNIFTAINKKTGETVVIKQGQIDTIAGKAQDTTQNRDTTQPQNKKGTNSGGTMAVETIKHEAEILVFLNQDAKCRKWIPFVFWYGLCEEGTYCLAMSYIPSAPLVPIQWLDNSRFEPPRPVYEMTLAQMLRDITIALEAIHGKGIVHRDIKPENILFHAQKRRWVLIDFGLATFYLDENGEHKPPSAQPRRHIIGTPNFVSCFVHDGHDPVRRDDLIALGYVAWWLRAGGEWGRFLGRETKCNDADAWKNMLEEKRNIAFNRYVIGDELKSELKSEFFKLKLASFLFECNKLLFDASPPYKEIAMFFKSIMDVLGK